MVMPGEFFGEKSAWALVRKKTTKYAWAAREHGLVFARFFTEEFSQSFKRRAFLFLFSKKRKERIPVRRTSFVAIDKFL
jgi:hypothetical protein